MAKKMGKDLHASEYNTSRCKVWWLNVLHSNRQIS